jgi:hypothetical protein
VLASACDFHVPASQEFFSLYFDVIADSRINEETPLLYSANDPAVVIHKVSDEVISSLPKLQIAILLLVQLAEPIRSQCIYPFTPQGTRRPGHTQTNVQHLSSSSTN